MQTKIGSDSVPIERIGVSAYTIPTATPEADGTLEWNSTTLVLVEACAGGTSGLDYTYADTVTARLIAHRLRETICGQDALATPGAWGAMVRAIRNIGRPGIASIYNPWRPKTHFRYPDDTFDFSRADLRCVGVGKCRKTDSGTMCPSYMVTLEEEHSTRGRARMLFEMLQGDAIGKHGWRDQSVDDALHLCLACKGCKGECPVNVDMATYKAEFLSHYYARRLRPRNAYAFGLIFWWAPLAARMLGLVNFVTQAPVLSRLAKAAAGMTPQRQIPVFATQTFGDWFRQRSPRNLDRPRLILWPDTFNNYFHPQTAIAAVEVLENAGYQVVVPQQWLCCGHPLYDYGMLNLAKRQLRRILSALREEIRAGTPVIVLEPSCTATFRDELVNFFPHDNDAQRLSSQTFTLGEFLQQQAANYQPPQLHRQAIVHGHCHHKAVMKLDAEEAILGRLELDVQVLDSGCCGMASAFGFEKGDRYDVSIKCGERVLLPAVRQAAKDTLIIADGFSCREQIAQTTDRRALHLAQVLQMALHESGAEPSKEYPEQDYLVEQNAEAVQPGVRWAAITKAGLLASGAVVWSLLRRRDREKQINR